jgi:ribosomal protein S18 acetylase RimI-like enzyme
VQAIAGEQDFEDFALATAKLARANEQRKGEQMQFLRAGALSTDPRMQISAVFVEGFYQWLCYFSKDKEKLTRALAHMFDLSRFFVAIEGEAIAAITAYTDGKTPPIHLRGKELRRHLGILRGQIALVMLRENLQNHEYPFEVAAGTGSIEFVATAPNYRGKGIAADLIEHVMEECGCREYVLEVADTNEGALRLYERMGFYEFHREREPNSKHSGVNFLVYMKRLRSTTD